MNFLLDMKTVFVLLMIGHLFTVILISAYRRQHAKDSTVNTFFGAKLAQALAWLLVALRGQIPDYLSVSAGNTLLFLGEALETAALLKLQGAFNQKIKRIYIILSAVNFAAFHAVFLLYNVEYIRIAVASFGTAAYIIIPVWLMIRRRDSSLLNVMVGYLYLLVFISLIGRGILALRPGSSMGLFTPDLFQTLTFVSIYLVMILGNTGFVLLSKEQADRELLRVASYDDLTGTLNRRTFILRSRQCLADYARKKAPVSLLLFDIDHFKTINDTYGHSAGDMVLELLASRIQEQLGAGDLFGRYGGDEFAVLMPGADETASGRTAERIREVVSSVTLPDIPLTFTISGGLVTVVPDQRTQLELLYTLTDNALYSVKKSGRNGVQRSRLQLDSG
ncbi:GGDEF domain-containing protein [Paenibacillus beijingensis]|uniref:GGDEF domain-containing protein n=1 Tax=Paenibacillus beijingensis TaxID=1126833 RepID=A0A0D5NKW3_9BACL|nr:GGDEF domain-containing protein [Paenibacillus beijingensis]AJY75765.1 hypothetical protein VN24_15900 [Paenibacillus beijingensis]